MHRYFRLHDDVSIPGRWHLGNPMDAAGHELDDPWQFTEGKPVDVEGGLRIPVQESGKPLDYSQAGFSIPIVTPRVASVFTEVAGRDVQVVPVEVPRSLGPYHMLVIVQLVRCIDDARSAEVRYWQPEDDWPEKVGQYQSIVGLRIDKARVGASQVFRLWGWPGALIVSEKVKDALERTGATGMKFTEV